MDTYNKVARCIFVPYTTNSDGTPMSTLQSAYWQVLNYVRPVVSQHIGTRRQLTSDCLHYVSAAISYQYNDSSIGECSL